MIRTRSFILLLFFLSGAQYASAQWRTTNGPGGNDIFGLSAIGTNIFAGNNTGVFLWSGDTEWMSAGLSGTGIQTLVSTGNDLLAGTSAGLYITGDLGADWDLELNSQYIFAFAFAPSGPNLVVGTDNGIFVSTNGGTVWNPSNDSIYAEFALAVSGSNLVAGGDGISISNDNGMAWNLINNALTGIDVLALTASGNALFAGTDGSGVFISMDNGESWNEVNNGLPDSTVNAIAAIGSKLFVGTQDSGVYLSTNNGQNWLQVNDSLTEYFTGVYSFASDGTYLYAGTGGGVWRRELAQFNGIDDGVTQPAPEPSLSVYPNPFPQSTTIHFTTPESANAEVTIVNILGAMVAHVFSGELATGDHSFAWDANGLPPGMYECIVQMNGEVQQIPIILSR